MLNKMKNIQKESGFTIVELLIVIVVIGILAAITIVSYTGITQKANTTKAQTNAVAVQKVAEAFYADTGSYPDTVAEFSGGTASLPSSVDLLTGVETLSGSTTKDQSVDYKYITGGAGACISYWDFTVPAISTTVIYLGNATSATCAAGATSASTGNRPA